MYLMLIISPVCVYAKIYLVTGIYAKIYYLMPNSKHMLKKYIHYILYFSAKMNLSLTNENFYISYHINLPNHYLLSIIDFFIINSSPACMPDVCLTAHT